MRRIMFDAGDQLSQRGDHPAVNRRDTVGGASEGQAPLEHDPPPHALRGQPADAADAACRHGGSRAV